MKRFHFSFLVLFLIQMPLFGAKVVETEEPKGILVADPLAPDNNKKAVPVKDFLKEEDAAIVKQKKKEEPTFDPKVKYVRINKSQEIAFGQSAFLSGGFKAYGEIIRDSIKARFGRTNSLGGVQGKMLRLLSLDDRGEAPVTKKNVLELQKRGIDIFLGNMGTRGVQACLPMIKEQKISMLFPWGGDKTFRDPNLSHIINGQGFLEPQIDHLVDHIVNTLKLHKVAIFHSDGTFGAANAQRATSALNRYGLKPVNTSSYNRYTMNIFNTAESIMKSDPKIVLCLSTSMPAVKLINYFFEKGYYGTRFIGIDSTFLVEEILKARGVPFAYGSYVPSATKKKYAIVREYQEDLKKYAPKQKPNILGLSYYIHAAIVVEGLKQIKGEITKENLLLKIEGMHDFNLGDFIVNFDPATRHAYPLETTIIEVQEQ